MYDATGEDTAFAPLLPLLFSILKGEPSEAAQTPADVGALYMAKMRARIPEVPYYHSDSAHHGGAHQPLCSHCQGVTPSHDLNI